MTTKRPDLCDPFACPVIVRIARIGERVRATLHRTGSAKLGHGLWAYKENADDTGQQGCNFEHEKHQLPDSSIRQFTTAAKIRRLGTSLAMLTEGRILPLLEETALFIARLVVWMTDGFRLRRSFLTEKNG
jgi:hypothetical protein